MFGVNSQKDKIVIPFQYQTKLFKELVSNTDKLLSDAYNIINEPNDPKYDYGKKLLNKGFKNADEAKEANSVIVAAKEAKKSIEDIEYYNKKYPMFKYIRESAFSNCSEYETWTGPLTSYVGKVPINQLDIIERVEGLIDYVDKVILYSPYSKALTKKYKDVNKLYPLKYKLWEKGMAYNFNDEEYRKKYVKMLHDDGKTYGQCKYDGEALDGQYYKRDLEMISSEYNLSGKGDHSFDEKVICCQVDGGYLLITSWGSDELEIRKNKIQNIL